MFKSLGSLIVFIYLLQGGSAGAASCSSLIEVSGLESGDIKLSSRLVERVRGLEKELGREIGETEKKALEVAEAKDKVDSVYETMNRRERYLWAWLAKVFGGDAQKILDYKNRSERLTELKSLLAKDKREDRKADAKVLESINAYLMTTDAKFRQLRKTEADLDNAICKGNDCLVQIEEAISKVEHAQRALNKKKRDERLETQDALLDEDASGTYDTLSGLQPEMTDFVTDHETAMNRLNYGVHGPNVNLQAAKVETKEARDSAKRFALSLQSLEDSISTSQVLVSDAGTSGLDFVFDAYLNFNFGSGLSSDFVDILKVFELAKMKSELEDLHTEVNFIKDDLKNDYEQLKENLDSTVCRVREMCRF